MRSGLSTEAAAARTSMGQSLPRLFFMASDFEDWFNIHVVQVDLIDFSRENAASRSIFINIYIIIYNLQL